MEIDWLLWAVAFLFFLPLHFGVPLLYLLIQKGPEEMRKSIPSLLLWGGISAVVGFAAALMLWPHSKTWAAIAVVVALVHPWFELIFRRRDQEASQQILKGENQTSILQTHSQETTMSIDKKLFRSGPYKDLFSQGVQIGNVLYLSGQVGVDNNGKAGADLTAQTALAYASIKTVLAEFGASMENIVDETFFVTNMAEFMGSVESVYTARAAAYGGTPEVSQTVVQVVALVQPELKIEIKCVAHL